MKLSDYRRLSILKERRQIQFVRAAITGILAGGIAVLFQLALASAENFRNFFLSALANQGFYGFVVFVSSISLIVIFSAFITVRVAPETTGSGIPHTKAVLLYLRPLRWARILLVKFFAGVLAIGAGLSLGREGPTVQLGAAIGGAVGKFMKVPRRSRTHLIACGAGAGLAAAFNAPLAGFIFVIEELRRELSPMTYGTALIAAVAADTVTRLTVGGAPSFTLPEFITPPLRFMPVVILVGLSAGVLGVLFNRSLTFAVAYIPNMRSNLPRWARAALVGAVVATAGWFVPETLGPGNHVVEKYIVDAGTGVSNSLLFIFFLLLAKFILTILCYCSGVPGGIFAPLLVQGALLGVLMGNLELYFFPQMNAHTNALGVIAMAAYFSSIVRAPLTGVILIIEMTSNYSLLFPLLTASLISYLVAEWFKVKPIYESLLMLNLKLRAPKDTDSTAPIVIDVVVESGSLMEKKKIRQLKLPRGCLIVTHKRAGEERIPDGESQLQIGDELTIIIEGDHATLAREIRNKASARWEAL